MTPSKPIATAPTSVALARFPRPDDWLVGQLPVGMLEDDLLVRLVRGFQAVADTIVEGVDNIDAAADVTVAPPPMVRFLGRWVGLDLLDESTPEDVQRRMGRSWGDVLAWRGTARGLRMLLELVSGAPVDIDDGGGVYRAGESPSTPAVVRVRVRRPGWLTEDDLQAVVADEVPIHVPHTLEITP